MEEKQINSRPIRVSEKVYAFIKSKSIGMGDTPDRILRRLLGLPLRKVNYEHPDQPIIRTGKGRKA